MSWLKLLSEMLGDGISEIKLILFLVLHSNLLSNCRPCCPVVQKQQNGKVKHFFNRITLVWSVCQCSPGWIDIWGSVRWRSLNPQIKILLLEPRRKKKKAEASCSLEAYRNLSLLKGNNIIIKRLTVIQEPVESVTLILSQHLPDRSSFSFLLLLARRGVGLNILFYLKLPDK